MQFDVMLIVSLDMCMTAIIIAYFLRCSTIFGKIQ